MKKLIVLLFFFVWVCGGVMAYVENTPNYISSFVSDVNDIEFLNLSVVDGDIVVQIQCSNNMKDTNFVIVDEASVEIANLQGYDCNTTPINYILEVPNGTLVEGQKYLVTATIPQTCNICSRSGYVYYQKIVQSLIPDANLLVVFLVLVLVVFILSRKRI